MTLFSRREFLQYLAIAGAVGASGLAGRGLWQQTGYAQNLMPKSIPTLPDKANLPLLLVTNNRTTNRLGPYLIEILRAEGLNLFQVAEMQTLTRQFLRRFALVLLVEGPVDTRRGQLLETYVAEGGRLIAMRPDPRLASIFGVEPVTGTTAEGYVQIDTSHRAGQNRVGLTLQFHGQADHYRLTGAEQVAWLYHDATTPTGLPAVTLNPYGRGQAALWAFDLARSVAYSRQGNPAWINEERDGVEGIRANDAFVDWIDLNRINIPQADEQMRLLSELTCEMLAEVIPLPRLWYFPNSSPAMLIATGDAHANPAANIEALLTHVESFEGSMSIYYTPPTRSANRLRRQAGQAGRHIKNWIDPFPDDPEHLPTPAEVMAWQRRGHEFSLHPYVESGVNYGYHTYAAAFEAEGYGRPSGTVRTHRILWDGWANTAKVQAANGFGMNLDFYHIGPSFQRAEGQWLTGYFTGSGLPMKMIDETGQTIENYQLLTELVDEYLLANVNAGWQGLDSRGAIAVSQQMIDEALKYHTALAAQFHFDFYNPDSPVRGEVEKWAQGTLAHAAERGIPIWSAARFLEFVRCRDSAQFYDLSWNKHEHRLTFHLLAAAKDNFDLTVRLPAISETKPIFRIEVDGRPTPVTVQREGERNPHALALVPPGRHKIDVWYA